MIASNLAAGWYEDNEENRHRGRPRCYSDIAIVRCLEIRCLFGLKLCQTQGFIDWLFEMAGIAVRCPDYRTLSKRMKMLDHYLKPLHRKKDTKFSCLTMDSTGIQTYTRVSKFLSRDDKKMTNEMSIKCYLLNKMFAIGKPISIPAC